MHNRSDKRKETGMGSTLKILVMLASVAEAARLHFCHPSEKINYILETSSSYDLPMSKRIAQAMSDGACGLTPGKLPGQTIDCKELFDLGSSIATDKLSATQIRVLSCPVDPVIGPSRADQCMAKMGNDEFNEYMNNIYFYLALTMMLMSSVGVLSFFLFKCFNNLKCSNPCSNSKDANLPAQATTKKKK